MDDPQGILEEFAERARVPGLWLDFPSAVRDYVPGGTGQGTGRTPDAERDRANGRRRSSLTEADARAIRESRLSQREIARQYGISKSAVQRIRCGESWAAA